VAEQIAVLLAATTGRLDDVPEDSLPQAEQIIRSQLSAADDALIARINDGGDWRAEDRAALLDVIDAALADQEWFDGHA
jgi:F0F1-type ATP synthase alpha subunit